MRQSAHLNCSGRPRDFRVRGVGRAAKARTGRRQRFASAVGGVPPTALRCSVMRPVAELTPLPSVRYVQTGGDKSVHERAARGAACPALLAAEEARCHLPARAFAETLSVCDGKADTSALRECALALRSKPQTVAARQAVHGRGDFWGDGQRRAGGRRACALQYLTRRGCLNEAERSERSEFCGATPRPSSAVQSAVLRRPPQHEPLPGTACRASQTLRKSSVETDRKGAA